MTVPAKTECDRCRQLLLDKIADERRYHETVRAADLDKLKEYRVAVDRALQLQAQEYERRLDILNHSHSEAKATLATYVPRIMYDAEIKNIEVWHNRLQREIDAWATSLRTLGWLGGAMGSLILFVVAILSYVRG